MARLDRSSRRILCASVAAMIYLIGLGGPALWEPDEGRYAEVAREMIVSGDYVTPRNNWVRYFEKPPLTYWSTAVAIRIFGANEFAVRFPAALASSGSVVVTEVLGEAMFGAAAGMLAALALGLSPLFFLFARFATPDPLLALCFTAALAAFYLAKRGGPEAPTGRVLMLTAAAVIAMGTLAKGPVALLLAGLVGLLWLFVEGRVREAWRIRWIECGALYLLIVAPWFIAAERRNPGFLNFFVIHEHLQRFLTNTEHGWGPWFFIPIVIAGSWPWLCFAPSGVAALRERVDGVRERGALRFLLIWFAVVFIFFSIPRSKLGEYILPGLPPLAILAGVGLARLRDADGRSGRVLAWYAGANVAVVLVAVTGVVAVSRCVDTGLTPPVGGGLMLELLLAGAVLVVSACAVWFYVRRSGDGRAVLLGIGLTALLLVGVVTRVRGVATPYFSYRNLARATVPYLESGCGLASYHHFVQSLPFYTHSRERLVGYRGELAPFSDSPDAAPGFVATDSQLRALWSAPSCTIIVVNSADWPRLAAILRPASLIGCQGKKIAMINREAANLPGPATCRASPSSPRP